MSELMTSLGDVLHIGSDAEQAPHRERIIGLIQHVPNLLDTIRKMSPADSFRVVMSSKNAGLFHPGADGMYPGVVRLPNGRIQEHLHLIKAGPDFANVASNVVLAAAMASIAHKLAVIDAKLDHITNLLAMTQWGRLRGALTSLAVARSMSIPHERRQATLAACQFLVGELSAMLGQLKAHIANMPEAKTGLFDGIFGNGFAKADKAFRVVQDEVQVVVHATSALLNGYAELDEPHASRTALRELASTAQDAGLQDAIRKARLLPAKPGQHPPEASITMLRDGMGLIGANLLADESTTELVVSIDLQVQELCLV